MKNPHHKPAHISPRIHSTGESASLMKHPEANEINQMTLVMEYLDKCISNIDNIRKELQIKHPHIFTAHI